MALASLLVASAGAVAPALLTSGGVAGQDRDVFTGVAPILYARPDVSWPYSSGPVYGTVEASRWNDGGVLHTQVGSFDLTRGIPDLPTELRARQEIDTDGYRYVVMQVRPEAFTNGAFDDLKRSIVEAGGAIVGEMPVAAFLVRMNWAANTAVKDSPSVIAILPYEPAFKLSPQIGRVPLLDPVKAASSVYSLKVQLFPGENIDTVSASLVALGAQVKGHYSDIIFVDADRSKLAAIAGLNPIFMVEEVLPIFLMSEETTTTVQTGKWNNGATPYTDAGIDGGGLNKASQADDQILAILDNGIQLDAGDLSNTSTDPGLDVNGLPIAGHRKVAFYGTTAPFGGSGDLLGCDSSTTSGVTHGHTVAAVALGNATRVPVSYGASYHGTDTSGNFWDLDGIAPKARLVAYDGQVTPLTGRCDDVTQIPTPLIGITPLDPGDLALLLPDAYAKGARVINFSWGSVANTFDTNAGKIDAFLSANSDAAVFVAAGNAGRDKNADRVPDPNTIGAPATAKNVICVGASSNADDLGDPNLPNSRAAGSSVGPATVFSNRIAPLVMAPGSEAGRLGLASEFHCRSNDNDQYGPVECDVVAGLASTSFSSAAAAGAGLVVRDYFAQGFYPDGTSTNATNASDQVPTISGALLKAVLVTSAEWMHGDTNSAIPVSDRNLPFGPNLTRKFRGNREQGFGRIVLTNALPLQTYPGAVTGLIVGDGGGPGQAGTPVNSTSLDLATPYPASQSYAVNVCDTSQRLTVAIAWTDPSATDQISRDLDLEVTAPSGRKYLGNFFTDDIDGNNAIAGSENCQFTGQPWPPDTDLANSPNGVDAGPWSLPTADCTAVATHVDHNNNVEAVFLSPDSRMNGINDDPASSLNEGLDNQIEQGVWTVTVKDGPTLPHPDNYSIAIAGGVCQGSAARVQKVLPGNQLEGTVLSCNDSVVATIDEIATVLDPIGNLTAANIAARTVLQVVDASDVVQDTETFAAGDWTLVSSVSGNLRFASKKVLLSDSTTPQSGNGALDVRDGQSVRVVYTDANPTVARIGEASVVCRPNLAAGGVVFAQFGRDAFTLVRGGCERDARGYFTVGFPDRYMDEGELVTYSVAFQSAEIGSELVNVAISLKAVTADADSPADCKPGTIGVCADPNRTNNAAAPEVTVLDSPKVYGRLPAGATLTPSFTIQMAPSITGTKKVDMLIGVTARAAGKGLESLIAQREILNVDEFSLFYSTDFPTGGTESVGGYDINNNEILETLTNDPRNFQKDYFFETRSYSDMTATNPLATLKAPWNFDTNDGGFLNGLQNTSRPASGTFAQWGEDKNFNGKLDGFCTGDTTIPCTQGIAASVSCKRCTLNHGRTCSVDADCQSPLPNEGTCTAPFGTCDFTLGEDRNPANGVLDTAWSTLGGCGWQTRNPGDPTGGVWHTGLIRSPGTGTCLATGNDPGDCQRYWSQPDGDSVGDNNWWELLLTPVLHKVNVGVDGSGDPIYQVAITNWAWNMSVDIPDTNTTVTLEFDNDVDKSAGVELFNDAAVFSSFRGRQGAASGGNGPLTNGFNMFARVSNCQDTDGNGSLDHCGTAAGHLCNANKKKPDAECGGGVQLSPTRGLCSNPPAQKKCTGNPNLNCTVDADCNLTCSGNTARACNSIAGTTCNGTAANLGCLANPLCGLTADGTCQDNAAILGLPSPGERCVSNPATCATDADCGGAPGSCILNAGNNREGRDNCVFLGVRPTGPGAELVLAQEPYGLATPPDDDVANGYCGRSDALNGIDKSVSCTGKLHCDAAGGAYASVRSCSGLTSKVCASNADCVGFGSCTNVVYTAVCNKPDNTIDEFVQRNGPGRNFDVAGGFGLQFATLEDFIGTTGNSFRAALGFNNREPDVNSLGIAPGLGVAVDDMVISWKETRLDESSPENKCAGSGECATLETSSTISYEGNSIVGLTVTDRTPYDATNPKNDCNGDGDFTDLTDDTDCNDNGKLDVTVKLTSDAEVAGEIAVLDQVSPGSPVYKTNFPYSTLYNSPGTLFVVQSGTAAPVVTALYNDRNDGTNSPCKNALEPTVQGFVTASTTVSAVAGRVTVSSYAVVLAKVCSALTAKSCNVDADCLGFGTCSVLGPGDDDGFADTNELNNLVVVFANKSGVDLDDLTATLGTTSPNIECITRGAVFVGSLADKALSNPANYLPFQFKVANVNRSTVNETLQAKFTLTIRSNKFDALTRATEITLDLDYNATGGGSPQPSLYEDFESGFGKFTVQYLDANKASLAASNGYRCQYNDPLGLNSQSTGDKDCFLGFTSDPATGVNDWHIHTTSGMGVGRAFTGKQSLHLGVHSNNNPAEDTARFKHIMSIRTVAPVNIGLAGSSPELNFAQQVSFADSSSGINVSPGKGVDRGIVEASVAIAGPWIKLYPYENVYDQQGTDDFTNCVFDPVDDGNNEDSFFDPTDPARRLGPSSTCFPEFTFVRQGQTDYRKDFDVTDIGLASDGPGLKPCSNPPSALCLPANTPSVINNPGTWVRPRFSLVPLAGKTMYFRFLYSSVEVGATETWLAFLNRPNATFDDGWYIDDVHIAGALGSAISLTPDAAILGTPLACGSCGSITPVLEFTPDPLPSPGQIVTLTAKNSTADRCINGILQYQFWNDANGDGVLGVAPDTLLRDWTDNASFVDAPLSTQQYGVKVRCSTEPGCAAGSNSATKQVKVNCPGGPFPQTITLTKVSGPSITINWTGAAVSVDAIRGSLTGLPLAPATKALRTAVAGFGGSVNSCLLNNSAPTNAIAESAVLAPGDGFYYLVRGQEGQKYTSGSTKERGGPGAFCNGKGQRDTELDADANACLPNP